MLYFIPGWYNQNQWCEKEQYWHKQRMHTEFDDIVKYIQLFQRNKICPFRIMLLSYAPNFRHFLHRQSMYHAPYWSCFDSIQQICRRKSVPISYHNLKWPEGIEFVYTMFVVMAMENGEPYAKVEFGEDGNMIEVELYRHGTAVRKNIYDDRGFLSSTILYRDGTPVQQDYLGEDGGWRIRVSLDTGTVRINPEYGDFYLYAEGEPMEIPFRSFSYDSLEQLIMEVVWAYVSQTQPEDIFCAAVHSQHMRLIRKLFSEEHLVLSLFEERNDFRLTQEDVSVLQRAGHLICDSAQGQCILEKHGQGLLPPITVITPFDTRPDFGISQQMTAQKILVPVDGLEEQSFRHLVLQLGTYQQKNPNAEVYLFTRQAGGHRMSDLLDLAGDILQKAGCQWENAVADDEDMELLPAEQPEKGLQDRWFISQCVDELSVTKCLRMQRLVVDMRRIRDVYLRVITVSMGIPQVLIQTSEFVNDGENGRILSSLGQLPQALDDYLGELANWNQAMISAYEVGRRFDTATQVGKWKGVIDSFEKNSGSFIDP